MIKCQLLFHRKGNALLKYIETLLKQSRDEKDSTKRGGDIFLTNQLTLLNQSRYFKAHIDNVFESFLGLFWRHFRLPLTEAIEAHREELDQIADLFDRIWLLQIVAVCSNLEKTKSESTAKS